VLRVAYCVCLWPLSCVLCAASCALRVVHCELCAFGPQTVAGEGGVQLRTPLHTQQPLVPIRAARLHCGPTGRAAETLDTLQRIIIIYLHRFQIKQCFLRALESGSRAEQRQSVSKNSQRGAKENKRPTLVRTQKGQTNVANDRQSDLALMWRQIRLGLSLRLVTSSCN